MSENLRYGREYGDSAFTGGDSLTLSHFYHLLGDRNYLGLSRVLGWSEGCPVVPNVLERGTPQAAAEGYGELQFIRGTLLSIIEPVNSALHHELTTTRPRQKGEPAGQFFPAFIPGDHLENVRGCATIVGYDLPRLVREFIGPRPSRTQSRIIQAFDVFTRVLKDSTHRRRTPIEFTVALAETYARLDSDPLRYVRRLLSAGKLKEDNQQSEATLILANMHTMKTSLYDAYASLTPLERATAGIAEIPEP